MSLNETDRKGFGSAIALPGRHGPQFDHPLGEGEITIQRAIDRASNAKAIGQFLREIVSPKDLIWKSELEELNDVLNADYRTAPALPVPKTAQNLAGILNTTLDPRCSVWKKWRSTMDFHVPLPDFESQDISVHAAPYTRGAGLLLWGFSCDARIGNRGAFIIFLNTAHHTGAVTTTMAHELGHYIHSSIASESRQVMTPLAANFGSHLRDEAELFSDSLVALSAYGKGTISKLVPRGDASPGATKWIDEIKQAHELIHPEYRMDFARRVVSARWRIRYLAATIHFFKLRKALFETASI